MNKTVDTIEAAELLGCTRQNVSRLIASGILRCRRYGRAVRIPLSEIRKRKKTGGKSGRPRKS